jgi:hypothetical protein
MKLTSFNRPGHASILTPNAGTAQECKTSVAVTIKRILEKTGKIISFVVPSKYGSTSRFQKFSFNTRSEVGVLPSSDKYASFS